MDKIKKYGLFAIGVLAVIVVARMVKPMLPASVQGWIPV